MREFKDDLGRPWRIHITCGSLVRVSSRAGFDIADISNGKAVELFSGNTSHLMDILWPLVEVDATRRQIDQDSFGDGLRGECISDAIAVLKEELLSFFPSARRSLMQRLLAKMDKMLAEMTAKVDLEIENAQIPAVNGGNSHTDVRESSESSQTSGLSGS